VSEPFLGEIRMFTFGFPPAGWALADGQLLPIPQNLALFDLLGNTFGGDGVNNFALPDLRGRMANHQGPGPGLTDRVVGESGGAETVVLSTEQLPNHTHPLVANSAAATIKQPAGAVLAATKAPTYAPSPNETEMNPAAIGHTGSSQPVGVLPPFLTLSFCISLQGIFPSQA
jgi:microcystin-dependent protein